MQCKRCGNSMMPETVIKLRRSLVGLRETRSQGAYCAACGIGWRGESSLIAPPRRAGVFARLRNRVANIWPEWRLSGMARPDRMRTGGMAAYDPLPLAR